MLRQLLFACLATGLCHTPCNNKPSCVEYLQDWLQQSQDTKQSAQRHAQLAGKPGTARAVWAWTHLGAAGGASINSHWYSQKDCFVKALELDPDHADAWSHLGVAGGGMVGSRFFNQTDCFVQVLKFKQNSSRAWSHLGTAGGGKVGSTWYTWKDCYEKSLELDPNYADTWANLGAAGGGKVSNHPYSETECYAKALELSPRSSSTWYNLGAAGGGKVKGTTFSACDCYVQSLELDPKFAPAWSNLGRCGGRKVKGSCGDRTCSPKDCYVTALELDPKYADAWSALGDAGGGTVGSTHYSWKDCKAKARAWTLHQEAETWYNFGLLGSGSIGSSQCNAPEQCFEKATDLLDQELDAVVSRLPVGSADDLRDIAISLLGESKTAFKDQMTAVFRECHPSTPSCLDAQDEQDQLATDLTQQMPHVPPETIRAVLKGALIQMQSTRSKLTELNDDTLLKAICEADRSWKRQHYTLTARKLASQGTLSGDPCSSLPGSTGRLWEGGPTPGLSVGATQAFLAVAALSALTMAFAVSLVWRRQSTSFRVLVPDDEVHMREDHLVSVL